MPSAHPGAYAALSQLGLPAAVVNPNNPYQRGSRGGPTTISPTPFALHTRVSAGNGVSGSGSGSSRLVSPPAAVADHRKHPDLFTHVEARVGEAVGSTQEPGVENLDSHGLALSSAAAVFSEASVWYGERRPWRSPAPPPHGVGAETDLAPALQIIGAAAVGSLEARGALVQDSSTSNASPDLAASAGEVEVGSAVAGDRGLSTDPPTLPRGHQVIDASSPRSALTMNLRAASDLRSAGSGCATRGLAAWTAAHTQRPDFFGRPALVLQPTELMPRGPHPDAKQPSSHLTRSLAVVPYVRSALPADPAARDAASALSRGVGAELEPRATYADSRGYPRGSASPCARATPFPAPGETVGYGSEVDGAHSRCEDVN
jgi:hypothetical protein